MPKESTYICPQCGSPVIGAEGSPRECPNCKTITQAGSPSGKDAIPDTLLAPTSPRPQGEPTSTLVGTGRPKEQSPAPKAVVPGYEILDELGRGGMGVVYKARHIGLNRVVALKMILSAEHAGREAVARFKAEAEAVAQLKHPNIIQVYDIGEQDGRPFFSMEYVEGGSLQQRIGGQPQPPRWCAEIAEKLAQAMHVAHSQGIVHRDLKPANVLLTVPLAPAGRGAGVRGPRVAPSSGAKAPPSPHGGEGREEPKIMDFGLAKRVESGEALTQSGAVMGTPQYMAPEQASGEARRVGPPADVYALGAILYTMLTGKPPFSADTALGVLRKVLNDEPAPPTTMHKRIPCDLETICLKCLQKEPQKRYASAQELAADLRRFLNHEPIVARPTGTLERLAKWARRRPTAAALIGVSVLALVALIGGGAWHSAKLADALGAARENEKRATEQEHLAKQNEQLAKRNEEKAREEAAQKEKQRAAAEKRLAEGLVSQGDALGLADRWPEALGRYDDARATFERLGAPAITAEIGLFEAYDRVRPALNQVGGSYAALSPDGRLAVLAVQDETGRGQRDDGEQEITMVPGGVVGSLSLVRGPVWHYRLVLFNLVTGREVRTLVPDQDAAKNFCYGDMAFSPDGKRVVAAMNRKTYTGNSYRVTFWDVDTGRLLKSFGGEGAPILTFDGKTLAVTSVGEGCLKTRLVDVASERELRVLTLEGAHGGSREVTSVALSPDGNLVAVGSVDSAVRGGVNKRTSFLTVFDMVTDRPPRHLPTCGAEFLVFSGDNRRLLDGRMRCLTLWDVATGKPVQAFCDRGRSCGTSPKIPGADDHYTVQAWDVLTWQMMLGITGPLDRIGPAVFSRDGKIALSTPDFGALQRPYTFRSRADYRVFTLGNREVRTLAEHGTASGRYGFAFSAIAFSPDDRFIVTPGGKDKTVKLWDVATGLIVRRYPGHAHAVNGIAMSADGRSIVSGSEDNTLKIWDLATGNMLRTLGELNAAGRSPGTSGVEAVAISQDGKTIASSSYVEHKGALSLWNAETGTEIRSLPLSGSMVYSAVFTPDGMHLVSLADNTVTVWEAATARKVRAFGAPPTAESFHLSFSQSRLALSSDGRLVLAGGKQSDMVLWNIDHGEQVRVFRGHTGFVSGVAISSDGRLAASTGTDGTARIWDLASGKELRSFEGAVAASVTLFAGVAFSHDSQRLAVGGTGLRLFDFGRPVRYREFATRIPKAREAIQKNENDAEALKTFGEWYAFRGVNDWAVEMLEKARKNGAEVSPLTLARCYWLLAAEAQAGDRQPIPKQPGIGVSPPAGIGVSPPAPHYRAAAAAEFQKEIARVKAQPVPQDAKAKLAREQEALYLNLCLQAVSKPAGTTENKR